MSSALLLLIAVLLLPQNGNSFPSVKYCSTRCQCRHRLTQICVVDPALVTEGDNTSAPQIQRKRRRRKADSFFLSSSQSTDDGMSSDSTTPPPETPTEESQPGCPFAFAMTFPRYRVDLSHNKNANNPESERRRSRRVKRGIINKLVNNLATKDGNGKVRPKQAGDEKNPWGVMSGIVQVFQSDPTDDTNNISQNNKIRKKLETIYTKEVKEGAFRLVSAANVLETSPLVDEDFFAAAAFWRMASDITQQKQNTKEWYLALPETTPSVASNLCDILNWYSDLDTKEDSSVQLTAQLDSQSDVPVIQFTASVDRQQQKQHPADSLPSGLDTERQTKAWVTRLLVELGVCPFTKSSQKSGQGLGDQGVPVANIMYRHSEALIGGGGMYLIMAGE